MNTEEDLKTTAFYRIAVIGVGGAGGNALDNIVRILQNGSTSGNTPSQNFEEKHRDLESTEANDASTFEPSHTPQRHQNKRKYSPLNEENEADDNIDSLEEKQRVTSSALKENVLLLACNTDGQALQRSLADVKLQLGEKLTNGLGAGSDPEVGRAATEESLEDIEAYLKDVKILFLTAGMGGGTGTGGAPVIAKAAAKMDILTIGVVIKPFHFEGSQRMQIAEKGIEELRECVDTLFVLPNQNLFRVVNEKTSLESAFQMADESILYQAIRMLTDLMSESGLINVDFSDIRTMMRKTRGKAMLGSGEACGERRAIEATEKAIACPLLDNVSIKGARCVLINISYNETMTLFETDEIIGRIREEMHSGSEKIKFGVKLDNSIAGIRVRVIATNIDVTEENLLESHQTTNVTTALHTSKAEGRQPFLSGLQNFNPSFKKKTDSIATNTPKSVGQGSPNAEQSDHLATPAQRETLPTPPQANSIPSTGWRPPRAMVRNDSPSANTPPTEVPLSSEEDELENLDIPAFLRKKNIKPSA